MLRTGAILEVIPPPVLPKSLRSSNFSFLYFGYKNLLLQTFTILCGTGFGFEKVSSVFVERKEIKKENSCL